MGFLGVAAVAGTLVPVETGGEGVGLAAAVGTARDGRGGHPM